MRREPSFSTRIGVSVLVVTVGAAVGCGGSASETPFPQPPIERELAARHERAWVADEGDVDSSSNVTGAALATPPSSDVQAEHDPATPSGETPAEAGETPAGAGDTPSSTPGVGF